MMVDVIEGKTLGEWDPDDSPLIVLSCSHAFTMDTLDGILELANYYESKGGVWTGVKPILMQNKPKPQCPLCRVPIGGIYRYGRVLNSIDLDLLQRKFIINSAQKLNSISIRWNGLESQVRKMILKGDGSTPNEIRKLKKSIQSLLEQSIRAQKKSRNDAPLRYLLLR